MNDNVSAFLRVIREGESSQDDSAYRMLYGGSLFESFAEHPNRTITRDGLTSTAAGAYQFLYRTWKGLVDKFGYTDFSPITQDAAAVQLIRGRGAYEDIVEGRFEAAIIKCNKEWASLPGSPYGQRTLDMARCKEVYEEYGGTYGMQKEGQAPDKEIKEVQMSSVFLNAALGALSAAIPDLSRVFRGSDVAERNQKAAEIVVSVAKEAIGAKNEQELVDSLKQPESVNTIKQALQDNWFQIQEAGGGGIKGAGERDIAVADSDKPLLKHPAFVVSMLLLPLVYITVGAVFWGTGFPEDLKVMVATAIVSGVLNGIMGFWLGTSISSARKTELMAKR